MMSPKEHAKLLGLFLWIYAGLHVLIFGFVALVWFGIFGAIMSEASRRPQRANEPNAEAIVGMAVVFIVIAVVVTLLFLVPKVVAGFGLRKGRSWAKVWTIVACCIAVLNFPIGTALGVYGFWFVFGDLGKAYFGNPNATEHIPPPPPNNWQ